MSSLYEDYDPRDAFEMPMDRLYRSEKGPFPGKVVVFAGIYPKGNENNEEMFDLWITDLLTKMLDCHRISRDGLKGFLAVSPDSLEPDEKRALESRFRQNAAISSAFAKFVRDPNAGKGPEHFC